MPTPDETTKGGVEFESYHRLKVAIQTDIGQTDSRVDLYSTLERSMSRVFAAWSVAERLRYLGAELGLALIYVVGLCWFFLTHLANLPGWRSVAGLVVGPAFAADGGAAAPINLKLAILTAYSLVLIVVLLMSAYSALLRKPPLSSAKDVLKLVLGFITGQISVAGFLGG